jgi:hypothetical protein
MKTITARKRAETKAPLRRCKWCNKVIRKPFKGCWFQIFCTGGLCRSAWHHNELSEALKLIKERKRRKQRQS